MNVRRVLLLINDQSRKGAETAEQVNRLLCELGHAVIFPTSPSPADFCDLIRKHRAEIDVVAVGGGDGSMNACIPSLRECQIPLAVIPLGTSNNLARGLGIPLTLPEACAVIHSGKEKRVDLGEVNDIPFLVVAGMGVSIKVNREVKAELKARWGMLAYVSTAFQVFRRYRPFTAEITAGEQSLCVKSLQISVCNGRHFGSGLTIAEDALIDDGQLDLRSVEVKRWMQIPGIAYALKRGQYDKHHPGLHLRAPEFTIRTKRPMKIDTDGEISTQTPAHLKVHRAAIGILVPTPVG